MPAHLRGWAAPVAQGLDFGVSYLVAILLCVPRQAPNLSELLFSQALGPWGETGKP